MEILNIRILRGQNYWSSYWKNLIELELDLMEYEERPTDLIPDFYENLTQLIPSLIDHYCSPGYRGGFLQRLKKGTWLGHVIEHIALELQWLAGMDSRFGRTRSAGKRGTYYVIFSYEIESAGLYAAEAAFQIVKNLARGKLYAELEKDLKN